MWRLVNAKSMRVQSPTEIGRCLSLLIYQHFFAAGILERSESPNSLNGLATSFRKDVRWLISNEVRMDIRVVMIAAAAAASAAGGDQPGKDERQATAPPPAAAAPVVLASANEARRPSTTGVERSVEPSRRPPPRVTTCRCGDPQPAEERPDQ